MSCVLYAGSDATVLIDPLVRPDLDRRAWDSLDRAVEAAGAPVTVLLTAAWHRRSSREVLWRYDGSLWVDSSVRDQFADVPHRADLPGGVGTFAPSGVDEGQVAFYIGSERTLVIGDFLSGTNAGLEVCPSPSTHDMTEFAESLRHLERLCIERVLVGHGPPTLRDGHAAVCAAVNRFARDI